LQRQGAWNQGLWNQGLLKLRKRGFEPPVVPAPLLLYGFQLKFMSAAPSVSPGMVNAIGLPAAGLVN